MDFKLIENTLDKICISFILIFTLIITILIGGSSICVLDQCLLKNHPKIKEFTWENGKIGSTDTAFILTFDRPMDHQSVENNLKIEPPLEGKIIWSGRRLIYTLKDIIPYGNSYRLSLKNAREKFRGKNKLGATIEPFIAEFNSKDRAFAYIASEGKNLGQLILVNLTKKNQTILTPNNIIVSDFKFTKNGEFIIFSASNKKKEIEGLSYLQLYQVSTGIINSNNVQIPGEIKLILDDRIYQNNEFDLAGENGEKIIVQRINRKNPSDFDLWLVEADKTPQRLNHQGGEFLVTPDGQNIALAQGEGIAIIPLKIDAQPLDFLPKFGRILSFSKNGSGAAMVNFNTQNPALRYTKSLVYVNNQSIEKELLNIKGSIIDCEFNTRGDQLYCLLTELMIQNDQYQEQPYFALIDLNLNQVIPLVALPKYQDIELSIAPDNFGILFDQPIIVDDFSSSQITPNNSSINNTNSFLINSHLWLLTLPSATSSTPTLEELAIAGLKPQWSP